MTLKKSLLFVVFLCANCICNLSTNKSSSNSGTATCFALCYSEWNEYLLLFVINFLSIIKSVENRENQYLINLYQITFLKSENEGLELDTKFIVKFQGQVWSRNFYLPWSWRGLHDWEKIKLLKPNFSISQAKISKLDKLGHTLGTLTLLSSLYITE